MNLLLASLFSPGTDPLPLDRKHPFWVRGYEQGGAHLHAYVESEAQARELWPDLVDFKVLAVHDGYQFDDEHPRPIWMPDDTLTLNIEVPVARPVESIMLRAKVVRGEDPVFCHDEPSEEEAEGPKTLRLVAYLKMYEYPGDQIQEFGGIPQNTIYEYVSSTFLDGLVNYGTGHRAWLMARYGLNNEEQSHIRDEDYVPTEAEYRAFAKACTEATHFKPVGDDWLVAYETKESYMFLWYDRDVSDCSIERWSKDMCMQWNIRTLAEFAADRIEAFKVNSAERTKHRALANPILIEAGPVRGWICS